MVSRSPSSAWRSRSGVVPRAAAMACRRAAQAGIAIHHPLRHPGRVGLDNRAEQRGRLLECGLQWMAAREQQVQQHAERVDVGRRRHLAAVHLLGRGVRRRQHGIALPCERLNTIALRFEQVGDAEVEQLHLPVSRDEHVRRFQVAVHDEVGVRVRDRREHVEEQIHAAVDGKLVHVAVAVDGLAVDSAGGHRRPLRRWRRSEFGHWHGVPESRWDDRVRPEHRLHAGRPPRAC